MTFRIALALVVASTLVAAQAGQPAAPKEPMTLALTGDSIIMVVDAFERVNHPALEARQRGGAMAAGVQLQAFVFEPHFIA